MDPPLPLSLPSTATGAFGPAATELRAGLVNARYMSPGGNKRTSDDNGRGPWLGLLVCAVLVVVIFLVFVQ